MLSEIYISETNERSDMAEEDNTDFLGTRPVVGVDDPRDLAGAELYREQMPLLDQAVETVKSSAAASVYRWMQDNVKDRSATTAKLNAEKYLYPEVPKVSEDMKDKLVEGIPIHLQDEIMDSPDLLSAQLRRSRIMETMERDRKLGMQIGLSSAGVQMLAGMVDLDAPLVFFSGGFAGAAKVARMTEGIKATRVRGALMGTAAGVQAGFVTGTATALTDDVRDWRYVADQVITMGLTAGAFGTAIPSSVGAYRDTHSKLMQALSDPDNPIHNDFRNMGPASGDNALGASRAEEDFAELELKYQYDDSPQDVGAKALNVQNPNSKPSWSQATDQWAKDEDWASKQKATQQNLFYRIANDALMADDPFWAKGLAKFATVTQRDYMDLQNSKAAGANFLAGAILESANGFGRAGSTAATLMELNAAKMASLVIPDLAKNTLEWARANGKTLVGRYGMSPAHTKELNLLVIKEMNARRLGKPLSTDPYVKTIADNIGKMNTVARELMQRTGVHGARNLKDSPGYLSNKWRPQAFMQFSEKDVVDAFASGYQAAGTFGLPDVARAVGKAMWDRQTNKARGIDAPDAKLMSLDSRESIENLLIQSGMPAKKVESVMRRLTKDISDRGKRGYLHSRNEVDLDTPIGQTQYTLADLIDPDIGATLSRYIRSVSGQSALAAKGLKSEGDINRLLTAINEQRAAVGEDPIPKDKYRAILSPFTTGGATTGYLGGWVNHGIDPYSATLLQATRTSLLQQLGLSQLMDTPNIIIANGLSRFVESGINPLINAASKAERTKLLEDLESMGVILGRDHELFAPHLQLDDVRPLARDDWFIRYVQPFVQNAEKYTNFLSGFDFVQRQ